MEHSVNVNHSDVSKLFNEMLKNRTNFLTYNFDYNGIPMSITCKLETRSEEL